MASEMGIFETIYNCRAMRKLDSREVPQEDLEKLISSVFNNRESEYLEKQKINEEE